MNRLLVFGDILALAMVTLAGFATHDSLEISALPRMLATFLPMLAGWFLVAPWLGLYETETSLRPGLLWRPVLAVLLSTPLAATLRGVILNAAILPIFVGVMAGSAGLGLLAWRALYLWLARRHRL